MSSGIKKTPARTAIADFLHTSKLPVDVEQILNFLRSKKLNTNKVTVYRILDFFHKNSFVSRLELQEGKFRYELAKNDHHHFVCEKCGMIEDISDCNIKNLEKELVKKKKLLIKRHSLEFFGICKNCQL